MSRLNFLIEALIVIQYLKTTTKTTMCSTKDIPKENRKIKGQIMEKIDQANSNQKEASIGILI